MPWQNQMKSLNIRISMSGGPGFLASLGCCRSTVGTDDAEVVNNKHNPMQHLRARLSYYCRTAGFRMRSTSRFGLARNPVYFRQVHRHVP